MSQPKIVRISSLPMGMVNSHLVIGAEGCILVDAGLPGTEKKFEASLRAHGLTFRDVRLIVVTHAHVDHAGGAAVLRELTGAPIVGHAGDAAHFARELPMTFCPTGWFGRLFLKTSLMIEPYRPFVPDILLRDDMTLSLDAYGVEGIVRHSPGHTEGSISVALDDKNALVGDLLASGILLGGIMRTGHAKPPPFEADRALVIRELERFLDEGAEHFYLGHGGPLEASEVRRYVAASRAHASLMLPREHQARVPAR
jgi:hydroxyacylglutathione hydrolase